MSNRIIHTPITLYAVIMGLSGLAIALAKFSELAWLPDTIYKSILLIVSILFVGISMMYLGKVFKNFEAVKEDFIHPVRINFFSAISISFLLLSIAFHFMNHSISETLWWIGVVLHSYLTLHTIRFWILKSFSIQQFNPAWFIPVVGNIIVPIMGVEFMPVSFSMFYFSVGIFFWIVLFTIFLNRVIFHEQLPQKFIPTFFILIAPAAIGFIAYYKITNQWDFFSEFLINLAYFFSLLLLFMYQSFRQLRFFISWWAFTFPLDALTIMSLQAYKVTGKPLYMYTSWVGLSLAILFIVIILYKTLIKIKEKELCIKED